MSYNNTEALSLRAVYIDNNFLRVFNTKRVIRKALAYLAKIIYKKDFSLLREGLLKINVSYLDVHPETRKLLENLLVVGEDKRHLRHIGFDFLTIMRAIKHRILYKKREGASTIDQQLVRVIIGDYRKTISRKIKELFLSTVLPDIVKKEDIRMIYLFRAYYGTKMEGILEAAEKLNIDINRRISYGEAAHFIARLKYPEPKKFSKNKLKKIKVRIIYLLALLPNSKR